MGSGCENLCKFRREHGPLPEGLQQKMFDDYYRPGASEDSQVRIVITYLLNV